MSHTARTARLLALMLAMFMALSACSSGSDEAADADADVAAPAAAESEEAESSSADESVEAAVSCDDAGEAAALLRGANGWLPQVVDAESNELVGATDGGASVLAAIETLRPAQDIEGPLGSMREGLNNMEADILAVQEGRFDDKVGGYSVAAISGVVGEEICS